MTCCHRAAGLVSSVPSPQRTIIPALPFCHFALKAQKPLSPTYPSSPETLGDHIRKRRLDLKLYQKQVAEILGCDEDSVCYWENNRTSPALKFIPKIIQFLGYNPYGNISSRSLGESIITYRHVLGITQEELALRLGVDPGTLGKWERNERIPWKEMVDVLNSLSRSEPFIDDNILCFEHLSSAGTFVPRDRRHDCTTFLEHGRL